MGVMLCCLLFRGTDIQGVQVCCRLFRWIAIQDMHGFWAREIFERLEGLERLVAWLVGCGVRGAERRGAVKEVKV